MLVRLCEDSCQLTICRCFCLAQWPSPQYRSAAEWAVLHPLKWGDLFDFPFFPLGHTRLPFYPPFSKTSLIDQLDLKLNPWQRSRSEQLSDSLHSLPFSWLGFFLLTLKEVINGSFSFYLVHFRSLQLLASAASSL